METNRYTLRELSEDFDISIQDLRVSIKKGTLQATKIGNAYMIADSELEMFLTKQFPVRNYLCENYGRCLDIAARKNVVMNCEGCSKYVQADTYHSGDAYPIWDAAIPSTMTMH